MAHFYSVEWISFLALSPAVMQKTTPQKKPRVDGQMTSLAGELFVAAELLKRKIQTSITFGNAKQIDLLAHNLEAGQNFSVQVKALRTRTFFPTMPAKVKAQHVYVFVLLNQPSEAVQYFIVPGRHLVEEPERFGKDFQHPTFPGIHPQSH